MVKALTLAAFLLQVHIVTNVTRVSHPVLFISCLRKVCKRQINVIFMRALLTKVAISSTVCNKIRNAILMLYLSV